MYTHTHTRLWDCYCGDRVKNSVPEGAQPCRALEVGPEMNSQLNEEPVESRNISVT